jgi:TP901 family phage tail tape measure protein
VADRTVKVSLVAQASNYIAGMEAAAAKTKALGASSDDASKKLANQREAMTTVGTGLLAIGAVAAAGVGLAVAKFAEFDEAMSNVQAATHETADNMSLLRDAALEAGASTVFSATEAANAIEELSKAGVSTADIIGGALSGALDLASAGQLDVARAAEIAATAMTQFGLAGTEVPHIADLLAAGAGKAQGSVEDLAQALNQGGLVASQTGLSIEETTAGLSAFAAAGLTGSDAGTSFKSMLQRLTPQSAEAQAAMDKLGISAYDAQGNFIGLEGFAGNLQSSLSDLTVEQRNSALATIFGSDAVRAASVLYANGSEGIADWTSKVDDSGYAAETARARMDNLNGDIEKLGGAFDTALIQTGSGANDVLRVMVQTVTGLVDIVGGLPAPVLAGGPSRAEPS